MNIELKEEPNPIELFERWVFAPLAAVKDAVHGQYEQETQAERNSSVSLSASEKSRAPEEPGKDS